MARKKRMSSATKAKISATFARKRQQRLLTNTTQIIGAAPLPFNNQLKHIGGQKSAPNLEALAQLLVEVSRLI